MQVSTIGLDLAKNVFQAHGVSAEGKVVLTKQLRRGQVLSTFAKLPPCLVGMEACAGAHYWARELRKLGHDVRLMPARDVKAYVKRDKTAPVPTSIPGWLGSWRASPASWRRWLSPTRLRASPGPFWHAAKLTER